MTICEKLELGLALILRQRNLLLLIAHLISKKYRLAVCVYHSVTFIIYQFIIMNFTLTVLNNIDYFYITFICSYFGIRIIFIFNKYISIEYGLKNYLMKIIYFQLSYVYLQNRSYFY